jgi:single-strand DNA-binding protein
MNLNRVTLAGRLTRDPELRYTNSGTAIAEISLAVSRFYKDQAGQTKEETDFIDLTAFGRSAEVMQKHLHKGNPLFVEGRLHLDQWDDKQTGAKRSKLKVIAESMQFFGPRPQTQAPTPGDQKPTAPAPAGRGAEMEPADIPF